MPGMAIPHGLTQETLVVTLFHPDRDIRQRALVPPERLASVHVLIIGVGAIGRQVALQLAAVGVQHLTLYDHDHVAVENLAVQGYWPEDLDQPKVLATAKLCRQILPDIQLNPVTERFRRHPARLHLPEEEVIVFSCIDSITTRKMLWETLHGQVALFLDGRMNAEVIRVLAQDERTDPARYTSALFSEKAAQVGSCTGRSTIYTASMAAGLMIAQMARWLRGVPVVPDQMLNLPSCEWIVPEPS